MQKFIHGAMVQIKKDYEKVGDNYVQTGTQSLVHKFDFTGIVNLDEKILRVVFPKVIRKEGRPEFTSYQVSEYTYNDNVTDTKYVEQQINCSRMYNYMGKDRTEYCIAILKILE